MNSRTQRRRERAARVAPPPGSVAAPRAGRRRLSGLRGLPGLPLLATAAGGLLLATAWTTNWGPGEGKALEAQNRFTMEIPEPQQAAINNWERFFICYDLLDPTIIDLTLRNHQRASGALDFPAGGRVEVVLPTADREDRAAEPPAPAAAGEDELIAARQAIVGAAIPSRMAEVRRQCAATPPA